MKSGEYKYVWQSKEWPNWRYDAAHLAEPLAAVHRAQGHLAGRMAELGLAQRDEAILLESFGLLSTRFEKNPGHGRQKIVEPTAGRYQLVANI